MAVSIRLRREGARNRPYYKVVVADSRSPRDGKFIEIIGTYDPKKPDHNSTLKLDRIDHWISKGAQPSDTVQRLIAKAKDWAQQLAKPVELWMSDKQDAFVKGIQAEFPDVPHRYCQNHFLRNLAKPPLEKDSSAKVQMRKKVRGLRDIEREVLEQRRERQPEQGQATTQGEEEQEVAPVAA